MRKMMPWMFAFVGLGACHHGGAPAAAPERSPAVLGEITAPADSGWWQHGDAGCPSGTHLEQRWAATTGRVWCESDAGILHGPVSEWSRDGARTTTVTGLYRRGHKHGVWTTRHNRTETIVRYDDGRRVSMTDKRRDKWCAPGARFVIASGRDRPASFDGYCELRSGRRDGRYVGRVGNALIEGRYERGKKVGMWTYRRGDARSILEYEAGRLVRSRRYYYAGQREWWPCPAEPSTNRIERLCGPDAARVPAPRQEASESGLATTRVHRGRPQN